MNRRVSVVVPCRNEANAISACVTAIARSTYPDLEIIVVDGMSEDQTRLILSELAQHYPQLKVVDNPHRLTPYAFNLGIINSTGAFVQIVGSRNILAPDYLEKMVEALEAHPEAACVGGDYQHVFDTPASRHISMAMESKFGVGASNYRTMNNSCFVDTVGVPMYRREIFNEIGLFDERLTRNQDDDFNYRVTRAGHRIYYCHEARTTYLVRGSYRKLFRQMMQYGYFKVLVNKKHRAVTTARQLVPPLFVLFLAGGLPLLQFPWAFRWGYAAVLITYLGLGFFAAWSRAGGMVETLGTQWAIATMHFGYGIGYLRGIADFIILGRQPSRSMQAQTT